MKIGGFWRRLVYLFHRDRFAADLQEEMRLHIELRARKLRRLGVGEEEAPYAARRRFGNPAALQDASAETWGWTAWERLLRDLRLGVRALKKAPGFAAVAVVTLAVGLGINTGVFSVVNAVMIRSLPYPQPDRLVSLWEEQTRQAPRNFSSSGTPIGSAGSALRTTVSVANLADYRQRARAFSAFATYDLIGRSLTGLGNPQQIQGEAVSAGFFAILGVDPVRGRDFLPEDDRPDADRVVILAHEFWERQLGGDPDVLSRSVVLDGIPHRVVGVLPRGFQSPSQLSIAAPIQFYVPAAYPARILTSHGDHETNVVGRLRPGESIRAAQAELDVISAGLARQYPDTNRNMRAAVAPLQDDLVKNVRASLLALLGASGLIVLITCVNVANLLLVRAIARRHETSVRFALGASRFRVMRQFLAESMMVAGAGCGAGIALGNVMMRLLVSLAPRGTPLMRGAGMDWRVFAVAAAVATLTGLAFGIAPAWHASQTKASEALKTAARNTGARSQTRWRTALTVAEIALSMVLLTGSGLLLRSFVALMGVDLGFQPDRILAMSVNLPDVRYRTATRRLQFFQQLEARIRALPGVQSVAFANRMPMRGGWGGSIYLETAPDTSVDCDLQAVSPGYFETLGIPLLRGRSLTAEDRTGQPPVAVVNQAFAREVLRGADPVGRRIKHNLRDPWLTVVGVADDIRRDGKEAQVTAQVYISAAQTELYPVKIGDLAIRTAADPRHLVNAIQSEVWALDKDEPVTQVRTLREIVDASVAQRRFQTLLLTLFAAVAVGLAMIGLFGVLSYTVSQRTNELGVRIALGATPWRILGLVLRQAGALIGAGVAIGLAGAWALTRYLESLLFHVGRHDWRTYLAAAALLAAASVAATLIPARRGGRLDPIVALRYD